MTHIELEPPLCPHCNFDYATPGDTLCEDCRQEMLADEAFFLALEARAQAALEMDAEAVLAERSEADFFRSTLR